MPGSIFNSQNNNNNNNNTKPFPLVREAIREAIQKGKTKKEKRIHNEIESKTIYHKKNNVYNKQKGKTLKKNNNTKPFPLVREAIREAINRGKAKEEKRIRNEIESKTIYHKKNNVLPLKNISSIGFIPEKSVPQKSLRSRSEELMNELTRTQQEKENLKGEIDILRYEASAARSGSAEKTQLQAKVANLEEEMGTYQQTIRMLERQLATLQTQLTNIQSRNTTRKLNRNIPTTRPNAAEISQPIWNFDPAKLGSREGDKHYYKHTGLAENAKNLKLRMRSIRENGTYEWNNINKKWFKIASIKKPTTIESGLINPYTGKYS
jgi:predicted  nucleic acid-binding Zn-ribbon protein